MSPAGRRPDARRSPVPAPEPVFEAVRVIGAVYEDGFAEPRRRRVVHRVTVYAEPARRLMDALGGDAFLALFTLVLNCEEDEATGLLRMPGGQKRLRNRLDWGEDRMKRVFKTLEQAGFATAEQHSDVTGRGHRFGTTFLLPHPRLCQDGDELTGTPSSGDEARPGDPGCRRHQGRETQDPGNPGAGSSAPQRPGNPDPGTLGPGNPDAGANPQVSPGPGFPGGGEARSIHDDDDLSQTSSSWDEPPAAPPAGLPRSRRSKTGERSLGDLASGLFPGADRKISGTAAAPESPESDVVGTPQTGRRLRPEASYEEVVAVLAELGFTDARRFARTHWQGPLVPWVNHVLQQPDSVKRPGAYLRSMLNTGQPAPAAPAPDPAPPSGSGAGGEPARAEPRPEERPEEPGRRLPQVSRSAVEALVADLPGDVADQVLERVKELLGGSWGWVEAAALSDGAPAGKRASKAAAALLHGARVEALWEFGLLPDAEPEPAGAGRG